ncbi:MAG: hypothetical protein KAK00_00915 [Nanoarchaeota archaeon]|nr:hypothetical protein [Nanoarchaeota archaeon]
MEFILIFAFSLVIIIPFINMLHSEYSERKGNLDELHAKQIIGEIELVAQNVYYAGYPSRTTLKLIFPRGIIEISNKTISGAAGVKSELIFKTKAGSRENEILVIFPFPIHTTLSTRDGSRKILIKAERGNYVNITDSPS